MSIWKCNLYTCLISIYMQILCLYQWCRNYFAGMWSMPVCLYMTELRSLTTAWGCRRSNLFSGSEERPGLFTLPLRGKLDVFSATDCHQTHICEAVARVPRRTVWRSGSQYVRKKAHFSSIWGGEEKWHTHATALNNNPHQLWMLTNDISSDQYSFLPQWFFMYFPFHVFFPPGITEKLKQKSHS